MKKILIITIITAVLFCGCTKISDFEEAVPVQGTIVSEPLAYPVTYSNLTFNSSPMTVGSLSPAVTEMLFELNCSDRLVFRSDYCNFPSEAESIPTAGSGANPDFDKIISYAPSLLITQSPIANKDLSRLSKAGISVLTLPAPSSLEDLFDNYEALSLIFYGSIDSKNIADAATSELKSTIAAASGSCESIAFIMNVSDDGFSAATGDTFAGDYIAAFGKNIAEDSTDYTLSSEELIAADPQVIFLANPLESSDIDEEIAGQLSAFTDGHVFVIDSTLMERPTCRLASVTKAFSEAVRKDTGGSKNAVGGYAEIPDSNN